MVVYNWKTLDSLEPSKKGILLHSVVNQNSLNPHPAFQVTTDPDPDPDPDPQE